MSSSVRLFGESWELEVIMTAITYRDDRDLPLDPLVALYRANAWSSAEKGEALRDAMRGSHSVVTAWADDRLVGLGNTLSDGHLVVYYPHLLVHPDFRRRGSARRYCVDCDSGMSPSTCTSWSPTDGRSSSSRNATSRGPSIRRRCGFMPGASIEVVISPISLVP